MVFAFNICYRKWLWWDLSLMSHIIFISLLLISWFCTMLIMLFHWRALKLIYFWTELLYLLTLLVVAPSDIIFFQNNLCFDLIIFIWLKQLYLFNFDLLLIVQIRFIHVLIIIQLLRLFLWIQILYVFGWNDSRILTHIYLNCYYLFSFYSMVLKLFNIK